MYRVSRNQLIGSAAATLQVLEVLGTASQPMGLAEITAAVRRPKGTVHRQLATLVNTGFAEQDPHTNRYRLTLKAWCVGARVTQNLDMVGRTRAVLEGLLADAQETVHLAVLDQSGFVVYVSKLASPQSIGVQTYLGQLTPAWCTATGRALLAFRPNECERILSGALESRTPRTVTNRGRLRQLIEQVQTQGYAVTQAENRADMGGIAAPVFNHEGWAVSSLGVALPEYRMSDRAVRHLVPLVVRAAQRASVALGYRVGEDGLGVSMPGGESCRLGSRKSRAAILDQ